MDKKTLAELEEKYDLELAVVVDKIKKNKAKLVLLQFPDGLKQYAITVVDYLEEKLKVAPLGVHQSNECRCKFLIWFDSCFGACDAPVGLEGIKPKIDLVIQFGHNKLMPSY